MRDWLLLIVFSVIVLAVPIWLAIRVKRHPEKDCSMRKIMEEQRGPEYEAGMQKFLMVNHLTTGLALVMAAFLELVFSLESLPSMLIAGCVFCLVLVIAKWHFTGEFSKAGAVTFAVGLVLTVIYLIVN